LLGSELQKLRPGWYYPTHEQFDITSRPTDSRTYDVVVHAAALTNTAAMERDSIPALYTNIAGTCNVVGWCAYKQTRLIYISSDYVFPGYSGLYANSDSVFPVNKYGWSKLGGECAVQLYDRGLIVRGSFGCVPFAHDRAFSNQWTTRLPVGEFAKRLVEIVERDPPLFGVVHIVGKRQTVLEYARSVSPGKEIMASNRSEAPLPLPRDTSLTEITLMPSPQGVVL
jgi:dTDP-4-dehydrorhamnose reductase